MPGIPSANSPQLAMGISRQRCADLIRGNLLQKWHKKSNPQIVRDQRNAQTVTDFVKTN